MENKRSIRKNLAEFLAVGAIAFGVSLFFANHFNPRDKEKRIVQKAIYVARGNDGLWSGDERKRFLNYLGWDYDFKESDELYLRVSKVETSGFEIIVGKGIDNDGGLVSGHGAGMLVGYTRREVLDSYVKGEKSDVSFLLKMKPRASPSF